jgi:hypothetical protein
MQKSRSTALLACVMFCVPFVLVGLSYHALPPKVPVLRLGIGHTVLTAPKSLFMVLRVPTMNLIHGLMAAVMLCHSSDFENATRRTSYSNMFSTLLFTIALKSDLEGMSFFAPTIPAISPYAHWIGLATLTCLLVGLGLALIAGSKIKLPWPELRLAMRDKIALCGLFAIYVGIVIASVAAAHRVS